MTFIRDRLTDDLTPEQVKANAKEWYRRQVEISRKALGTAWEDHREWVEAYLQKEIKERLMARGWRPKA
ncbi:hypothetical protein FQZ97_1164320 [compost metagenome]